MGLIDLPDYLFKYISLCNDYHKRMIYNNEIFFASIDKLNDPYDSVVMLRYDLATDEQINERYKYYVKLDHPNLTDIEVERVAKNEMRLNDIKNKDRVNGILVKQRKWVSEHYGIFSMSSVNDSVLMWSHYSDAHKGICIRFNIQKFLNFIRNDCVKERLLIVWNKVEYLPEYPLINPFELTTDEIVIKPLLIKSNRWKYENEIRFILFDHPDKALIVPDGVIDQIILGCKITTENRNSMIEISRQKNLAISQSCLKSDSFGLELNDINID